MSTFQVLFGERQGSPPEAEIAGSRGKVNPPWSRIRLHECLPCVALGYCVGNAFENFVIHLRRISVFLCSTSVSRLAGQLRLLHSPRELVCLDSDAFGVSRRTCKLENLLLLVWSGRKSLSVGKRSSSESMNLYPS